MRYSIFSFKVIPNDDNPSLTHTDCSEFDSLRPEKGKKHDSDNTDDSVSQDG